MRHSLDFQCWDATPKRSVSGTCLILMMDLSARGRENFSPHKKVFSHVHKGRKRGLQEGDGTIGFSHTLFNKDVNDIKDNRDSKDDKNTWVSSESSVDCGKARELAA